MDSIHAYDAILFPSDGKEIARQYHPLFLTQTDPGRQPSLVRLMTSPMMTPHHSLYPCRIPHPEVYMEYVCEIPLLMIHHLIIPYVTHICMKIAEGLGPRVWKYHLVEALDGMLRKFTNPYIIFYPIVSRDGMPFPVNKSIRGIQARSFKEEVAWRGNVVIVKYHDSPFSSMMDTPIADFAILRNYLMTHGAPR
ncbi:hypothetical protein J132_08092 [Termitomyces sp. J132]|nr:hypothetical protein J132_08092 [Termitomyces sp. J132]